MRSGVETGLGTWVGSGLGTGVESGKVIGVETGLGDWVGSGFKTGSSCSRCCFCCCCSRFCTAILNNSAVKVKQNFNFFIKLWGQNLKSLKN